jgi:hypothetical protein
VRLQILIYSCILAQFQTMNIGTLGQPNVVTIHQGKDCLIFSFTTNMLITIKANNIFILYLDMIQHPQSSVVSLPATILTATVAGAPGPGPLPPSGVHVSAPTGPLPPSDQPQVHTIYCLLL